MIKKKKRKKKAYFLGHILKTRLTDDGKGENENIGTSVAKRPEPVVIFLTCKAIV